MIGDLPPLTISNGSSGLEVRALLPEGTKYNCAEFTYGNNIQVMIAPWIQFEPSSLADMRMKIVSEILRRAILWPDLIKAGDSKISVLQSWMHHSDSKRDDLERMRTAWSKERAQYGRDPEFADYPADQWPKPRQEALVSAKELQLIVESMKSKSPDCDTISATELIEAFEKISKSTERRL